ncbi:DUF3021 family protein [Cellulosilyticum ruminicola]|uniref:DUF3021 family protein n=1 Tax=Cellulosilyticum ruminicola TaxID=425254 RepID=UPI0006D1992A|nr:DUF3021 family protein [Cellulosilyticum ruminicola]
MQRIKYLASLFPNIATGILISSAIFLSASGGSLGSLARILWQLIVCAFLCTLGSIIYPNKELSKKQTVILAVINYIYVNMIVIGCGIVFEWFDLQDWGRIIILSFLVAIVFIVVWCISVYKGQKLANEMNKKLAEYQKKKK